MSAWPLSWESRVPHYGDGRDIPGKRYTSRLSPHLRFGEISPRQVWHQAQLAKSHHPGDEGDVDKFLSEIGWREFCKHLVALFPEMPDKAFNPKFEHFPWAGDPAHLRAWQKGQTGYPIVDAGMRELWQTGFMHNRVRMVVASFLTKHLLTHWREGSAGSGIACSMQTSPLTPAVGNGSAVRGRTPHPTSVFSIQSPKVRSLIRTVTTRGIGCQSLQSYQTNICINLGKPPSSRWKRLASSSARPIPNPLSIINKHAKRHWQPTAH
jgi:hypothetical protein